MKTLTITIERKPITVNFDGKSIEVDAKNGDSLMKAALANGVEGLTAGAGRGAGGRGSRLKQLTDNRAKPAVHFGGKFRIIDFVLSNCINSGIRRIGVVTQYKSHSLLRHLQSGWSFLRYQMNEFIELPTSENIARWIWDQLRPVGPLVKVKVFRGSIGFGVEFDLEDAKAEGRV